MNTNNRIWIATGILLVALMLVLTTHRTDAQSATDPGSSITIPEGYRQWPLISVAAVGAPLNDLRAKLGNDIAMNAFRQGAIPFPDGTIIARLAWKQTADPATNAAFERQGQAAGLSPEAIAKVVSQSFVAGPATNVQFMVKTRRNTLLPAAGGSLNLPTAKLTAYRSTPVLPVMHRRKQPILSSRITRPDLTKRVRSG